MRGRYCPGEDLVAVAQAAGRGSEVRERAAGIKPGAHVAHARLRLGTSGGTSAPAPATTASPDWSGQPSRSSVGTTDRCDDTCPTLPREMDIARSVICPILVGRDELLGLSLRRVDEALAGEGRFLVLAGEAGIGKSRLLGAIVRAAVAAGFGAYHGATYPSDLYVAGATFLDLARAMRVSDGDSELGEAIEARLEAGAVGAGDEHRRQRMMVLDIVDLLVGRAAAGPMLLALEDLHWADDQSLAILESLARRVPEAPLLVVGTYRSDELFPRVPMREWRSRLVGRRLAEEVRLERLDAAETAQMAMLIAGDGSSVRTDVVAAIHERSDGIPLHIEELLGAFASTPDDAATVMSADVPSTVEGAVMTRLERRGPAARSVAEAAAVIGRRFDVPLLADVAQMTPEDLVAPLRELATHHLIESAGPGGYGFRHALICDAIYAELPGPRRRLLHERVADTIDRERRGETAHRSPSFLASHLERAGRSDDAYRVALEGAEVAAAGSSHGEARELYAVALRTAPTGLAVLDLAAVHERFAEQAAATDANHEAVRAYAEAHHRYLEEGDPVAAAAVVGPMVSVQHLLGVDLDERLRAIAAAMDLLATAASQDPTADHRRIERLRARLLAEMAAAYMLDRRLDPAIRHAREAIEAAAAAGDLATEHHARTTLGVCEVFAGSMDAGWANLVATTDASREERSEAAAARGYRMLGSCASVLVEYDRAERWLREGIGYAESVELWNHRHYMAAHLGHVLWATGRWTEALAVARQALSDGRGGRTTRITALYVLGYIALGRGSLVEARVALEEARILGDEMSELQRRSPAWWGLAELALLEDRPEEAIRYVETAAAASAAVSDAAYLFPFAVTGTRAWLAAGDPTAAGRWVDEVVAALVARSIPGTLGAIDHARGLLALANGRTAQARTHLRTAVAGWIQRGRAWEGTWATVDLARAHWRAHQPLDAATRLAEARAAAVDMGASTLLLVIDEIGASKGESATRADPWSPLSAREFEVARLVAVGGTNAEIAAELGLSPKTVSAHIEHILDKLGVQRRTEIAAWVASRSVLRSRPPSLV